LELTRSDDDKHMQNKEGDNHIISEAQFCHRVSNTRTLLLLLLLLLLLRYVS
jgi:hypothetical protein